MIVTPDDSEERCAHRAAPQPGDAVISLHSAVLEAFAAARADAPPLKKNEPGPNLPLGLSRFLGIFILFHLDVPATVRRVAMEMMDTQAHTAT